MSDNIAGATFKDPTAEMHYAETHFAALKRLLDAEDRSYTN